MRCVDVEKRSKLAVLRQKEAVRSRPQRRFELTLGVDYFVPTVKMSTFLE